MPASASGHQLPLFDAPLHEAEITPFTTLDNTITLFQQHLRRAGKTDHTVDAFTSDLHLLADYSGGARPVGAITTSELNDYLHWMEQGRGVPCSRKTYARRVTTLKVYFKWLHGLDVLENDPAVAILQRSGAAPLSPILSPDEMEAARAATRRFTREGQPDHRPALLLELLLQTGLKKNEVMRLERGDFDRELRHSPRIRARAASARTVYKDRFIAIDSMLLTLLDEYLMQYAPKKAIFDCTARNLEYVLEAVGNEADVPTKLSFEILRWTCAVHDYQTGMPPDAIRDKLGLSPVSWTETFLKIRRLSGEPVGRALHDANDEAL